MVGILIRIKRDIQIYKLIYHLVVIKKEHIEIINMLFNTLLAYKRYTVTKGLLFMPFCRDLYNLYHHITCCF